MFQVKKEGSKQNKLVSVFRKMFARQISKGATSSAKIAKQNVQKLESWWKTKRDNFNI